MRETEEIIERLNVKNILETVKNEGAKVVAIRGLRYDENYAVGDWCRNSYDWNHELDQSSYDADGESIELPGTCGVDIWNFTYLNSNEVDEAKNLLREAIESAKYYGDDGRLAIIVGYNDYEYGEDENEIIIRNAQVIALV